MATRAPKRPPAGGWVIDASITPCPGSSPTKPRFSRKGCSTRSACKPSGRQPCGCWNAAFVLQSAQRRRRIDSNRRAQIASELAELPVRIDREAPDFVTIDRLTATHGLSACDAAYLELALRGSLTLVSLDAQLVAAARSLGHPVITAALETGS